MPLIDDELDELKRCCENQIPDSKVVAAVPAMVRVEITKTTFKKIVCCLMFPNDYPNKHILIELKSKTLSDKLLSGLTKVCEDEAKKYLGRPQILKVLKLVAKFIEDNPLCSCSEEISTLRSMLGSEDTLKLSQKTSTINLTITKNKYLLKTKITIPENYPHDRVEIKTSDCNFPRVFKVWFIENSKELARRCVEAPKKPKPNAPKFEVKPSLLPAVRFLIENVQRYPEEKCQICKQILFPEDPDKVIHNEKAAAHVERVYCGHAYHHDCLILYMKTPPFQNGKNCPACGNRIYHEKWKVTPELAEARWATEQAKLRELGDVVEFIRDCTL
eukprot:TRINITY_DN43565_c0_g1_i1.p1 TRINITY_DN43565_c0_g1~~TRINITY_DN43565_c0_g1_i1.p1  ORF type:complete len:331 (-),score=38.57 TRINITY_DN43565_c0_g1_i1:165-1157(-)